MPLPARPDGLAGDELKAWVGAIYAWTTHAAEVLADERTLRGSEHDCLKALRREGVIR